MSSETEKTILVLDDDQSVGIQIQNACKKINIKNCVVFESKEQIEEYITSQIESNTIAIDFILVNVHMSHYAGTTFMQFLSHHPNATVRQIPIIAMVGKVNQYEVNILGEIGIVNFINKPLTLISIMGKLLKIIAFYHDPNSIQSLDREYRKTISTGNIKKALEFLELALQKCPASSRLQLLKANCLVLDDQLERAAKLISQIIKAAPDSPSAYECAAKISLKKQDLIGALRFFEKSNHLSPLNVNRITLTGELILATGKASVAESRFKEALKISADCSRARIGLAGSLAAQGRLDEAFVKINNQAEKEQIAKQMYQVADEFIKAGSWQQAILLYEHAFKIIDPSLETRDHVVSQLNLIGVNLVQSGKYADGVLVYERASKITTNESKKAAILYNSSLAWIKQGYADKALETCKYARLSNPGNEKVAALISKIEKGEVVVTKPTTQPEPVRQRALREKDLPLLQHISDELMTKLFSIS